MTTLDAFFDGAVQLRQPRAGHRVGLDALLLASATPPATQGLILDIGAGTGLVGLAAAYHAPQEQFGLVEIDPQACAFARENIVLNQLQARGAVYEADVASPAARRREGLADESARLVLTNPPFYDAKRVQVSPDPEKARAHVAAMPLVDWTRACLALLAPGGTFVMIHRADALADCLAALNDRLGAIAITPVTTRMRAPATRILLRGVKGSKAPLSLLPSLTIHHEGGATTPQAQQLNKGVTLDQLSH